MGGWGRNRVLWGAGVEWLTEHKGKCPCLRTRESASSWCHKPSEECTSALETACVFAVYSWPCPGAAQLLSAGEKGTLLWDWICCYTLGILLGDYMERKGFGVKKALATNGSAKWGNLGDIGHGPPKNGKRWSQDSQARQAGHQCWQWRPGQLTWMGEMPGMGLWWSEGEDPWAPSSCCVASPG